MTLELLLKLNVWAHSVAVWLNADVAAGPGSLPSTIVKFELDGRKFLTRCCKVPEVVLSLGWASTEYSNVGEYTEKMIQDMLECVQKPFLKGKDGIHYTPAKVAREKDVPFII